MLTPDEREALDRGAADYLAGRHMNPYPHETRGPQFRAWINGWASARAASGLSTLPAPPDAAPAPPAS